MSIVRVGTTKQYADNWDNIFGGSGGSTETAKSKSAKAAKPSAKKKAVKKKAAANRSKRRR